MSEAVIRFIRGRGAEAPQGQDQRNAGHVRAHKPGAVSAKPEERSARNTVFETVTFQQKRLFWALFAKGSVPHVGR